MTNHTVARLVLLVAAVILLSSQMTVSWTSKAAHRQIRSPSKRASSNVVLPGLLAVRVSQSNRPTLPRDVKEAVTMCRQSVQQALQKQISRMAIDFPVGAKFGVEKNAKRGNTAGSDGMVPAPTVEELDRSDRELARLFVEMFQPVGGEHIAVTFRDETLADAAKKSWKEDASAASRVLSLDSRKITKEKQRKAKGFAAKMAAEIEDVTSGSFQLPVGTEVALFVAPGPKELIVVERICEELGMGTLVVLLNARLSSMRTLGAGKTSSLFQEDFEPVFVLSGAPQNAAPGCILYRAFPHEWVLGRKPTIGPPKTLLATPSVPTESECRNAFDSMEVSSIEKGIESTMGSIAGWFR